MSNLISNFFGSVLARLVFIFGSLAAMTAAAIIVGWMVFQSIATNMTVLSDQRLPELQDSARVVSAAGRLRGVLTDILIADTQEEVEEQIAPVAAMITEIRTASAAFTSESSVSVDQKIDIVETALKNLNSARSDEFSSRNEVAQTVRQALLLANQANAILATASDDAFFDLVTGGDNTINGIDATLTTLIEQDFLFFQATLGSKAEINQLSGLALSIIKTRDQSMISILQDLGNASEERLKDYLDQLDQSSDHTRLAEIVRTTSELFIRTIASRDPATTPGAILSERQKAEAALSSSLDDIYFEFVINSETAKEENAAAIHALLNDQVARIRNQADMDSSTQSFIAAVLQTALARDQDELNLRRDALLASGNQLREAIHDVGPDIASELNTILQLADEKTGVSALRSRAYEARQEAIEATMIAAEAVQDISLTVSAFARESQKQIEETSAQLNYEVVQARQTMQHIGLLSLIMVLIFPLLIWSMITRPLKTVTGITERIAGGDLSHISGTRRFKGEIGQLARALEVFRVGALEKLQLEQEEDLRKQELLDTERRAEQLKREAESAEREANLVLEREKREREEQARTRKEEERRAVEEERRARAAEQEIVVSELAASLRKLSVGDLTHLIAVDFPGEYEALRCDYNSAISNLANLIGRIGQSASAIDGSSAEIASSSADLSRRTENSAATLKETASALNELTSSVASAACGASAAAETVDKVRDDAEAGISVMQEAVIAMSEIENSSSEIGKIVEVIDSIAFQTNLLALNAGVEAARAGDAGRGFAVVASEVRILAHRCSEAALQINALINASAGHVEKGVSLMARSSTALTTILDGVTNVSSNVSEIAVSATEQSSGIGEINSAVDQLDQDTQKNAAMFEETTAIGQSLTDESGKLAQVISALRIDMNNGSSLSPDKSLAAHGEKPAA